MMGRTGETFSGKRPKQTMIYYSPENEQSARHTTSVKDKMIHGSVQMGIVFICWSDSSLYALLLYVSNTSIWERRSDVLQLKVHCREENYTLPIQPRPQVKPSQTHKGHGIHFMS